MNIQELRAESERRAAVPVLRQLWSDAEPAEILTWTGRDGYHLFGGFVDGELVGVAGVLVTDMLHHVRHAWLCDLVVDDARREKGHGTALVEFVEDWATEKGCEHVALASPLAKEEVHQYYENRDFLGFAGFLVRGSCHRDALVVAMTNSKKSAQCAIDYIPSACRISQKPGRR